jgi:hemolysin III
MSLEAKPNDLTPTPPPLLKPRLRGVVHQIAFFVSIVACAILLVYARNSRAFAAAAIYSVGLLTLFGTSTLYHRHHWKQKARALMKRLDHSAIFILIAGSSTPFALLALPEDVGTNMLIIVWSIATIGVLKSMFWSRAPRTITTALYVAAGWSVFPYLPLLQQSLGETNSHRILIGGLIYTIGGVGYALKRPVLNPAIFGYHEVFHVMTIIAAAFHFAAIFSLTS